MRRVIVSHAGKQHSYHLALALRSAGYLKRFYTSSYIRPKYLQFLSEKYNSKFWSRRFLKGLDGEVVKSNWRFEFKEFITHRLFGNGRVMNSAVYSRDIIFDRYVSKLLELEEANMFWGFQGSCYQSLIKARALGLTTVYEFPSAHYQYGKRILEEEKNLHPEWEDSFAQLNLPRYYEERLLKEPELADHVIVSSSFSKKTMEYAGLPEKKIVIIPLGAQLNLINSDINIKRRHPLKILYVGRISQAKGIEYLLAALKKLPTNSVNLTLIGHVEGSGKALERYKSQYKILKPRDQESLFNIYKDYDVLVHPSIFEGFGLVILEALAAGLPVITTPNTVGPDVIDDGKNGYIVPIRNSRAIAKAIESLLDKSDDEFIGMKHSARQVAINYDWNCYASKVTDLTRQLDLSL